MHQMVTFSLLTLLISLSMALRSPIHSATFSTLKTKFHATKDNIAPQKSDFLSLRKIYERCKRLSSKESEFMMSFWSSSLNGFQIYPNIALKRLSITTTCISLLAILSNPIHWDKTVAWNQMSSTNAGKVSIKDIIGALANSTWSGDAFQTPVIVSTLTELHAVQHDCIADHLSTSLKTKFTVAIETLLEQRSRLSMHRSQPYSAYLRHRNTRALLAVTENKLVPESIVGSNRIGYALERANMVAFDELCRQLAFYYAGDNAQFDVIVLAYTLMTYFETSQSLFLSSFARGVVPGTNFKLVKSALSIVFGSQTEDGTWTKGEPIFSTGERRNIGNNYIFFFDMVASLMDSLAVKNPELFAPYLSNLERCIAWAESNIIEEMMPENCDPVTLRCYGNVVRGWRSNHLDTGGAVGWCTANVFHALTGIRRLLASLMTNSILEEFNGVKAISVARLPPAPTASPSSSAASAQGGGGGGGSSGEALGSGQEFAGLMDADLLLGGAQTSLKQELFSRLLVPQVVKERSMLANMRPPVVATAAAATAATGNSDEKNSPEASAVSSGPLDRAPVYSCILFGPPGTAKTTICTSLAAYLGWHFVTIDTASFLAEGLENVASRMTYIFERLKGLERTIILFDEIEEFCLDRENPALSMQSRMLTTAMLTQLNDLRRQQTCIFIVATNRLRSFDSAVTRPGRFDMLLFVGTPNLSARMQRLQSRLRNTRTSGLLGAEELGQAEALVHTFMLQHWEEVRFLTFAENEAFINGVTDLVGRGSLSDEALASLVGVIGATATIKGSVRDDYIASESLSRV